MAGSVYPESGLWFGRSHFTGTTGSWVDLRNIGVGGSFYVVAPPALGAAVTVSFETADADATNDCNADAATATAMTAGGMCDTPTALQIVLDPASTAYDSAKGQSCLVRLQCRGPFVRAKLSAATAGVTVDVIGPASRLASIA